MAEVMARVERARSCARSQLVPAMVNLDCKAQSTRLSIEVVQVDDDDDEDEDAILDRSIETQDVLPLYRWQLEPGGDADREHVGKNGDPCGCPAGCDAISSYNSLYADPLRTLCSCRRNPRALTARVSIHCGLVLRHRPSPRRRRDLRLFLANGHGCRLLLPSSISPLFRIGRDPCSSALQAKPSRPFIFA
ncbi:hypothetical protein PENSPDRAFT_339637 [Peniophora sp. CONT]|nr:hypothetical protein PENSPDRAFT_339637 [Peniophora sp. CONT]